MTADSIHAGPALLNVFALFHLNLAFSSIEEEQRAEVVRNCYGPLLDLAERHGPIGIEATAYTLLAAQKCDPGWLARLAASGYESAVVTEDGEAFRSDGFPVAAFAEPAPDRA